MKSQTKLKTTQSMNSLSGKYKKNKQKKCVHFNINPIISSTDCETKTEPIIISKPKKKKLKRKKESKHRRKSTIISPQKKKEYRSLSTWTKMEIAEWLQLNWYKNQTIKYKRSNKEKNKLHSHINKIKREKKFNGENIETLNNRRIIILAKRQLGLKKDEKDYKIFINRIHELQSKYSSKKQTQKTKQLQNRNRNKNHIKYRKRNRSRSVPYQLKSNHSPKPNGNRIRSRSKSKNIKNKHNLSNYNKNTNKIKTVKTRKKSLIKRNKKYKKKKSKSAFIPLIERSYTSPAISDSDNKYIPVINESINKGNCGVTDDELLTLFSYGHSDEIDTDYDGDVNYCEYIAQTMTPSPKNFDNNSNSINTFNYNIEVNGNNKNKNRTNNKTTVIPSIFSLSDVDSNNNKNYMYDICLSPIVSRDSLKSENMSGLVLDSMYYTMTDEETDDESYPKCKYNKNIKNMVNDIKNGILF